MRPGPLWSRRTVGAAFAAALVLLVLLGSEAWPGPRWRASAGAGVSWCLRGHWSTWSGDRLHRTGQLVRCTGRLLPMGADRLELAVAVLLVVVLVCQIWLLIRGPAVQVRVARWKRTQQRSTPH